MSIDQHLTRIFDDTKTGRFHTPTNFLLFVTIVAACIAVWCIGWDALATIAIQIAIVIAAIAGVVLSIASFSGDEEKRRRRSLFAGISLLSGVILSVLMWLTGWEVALNALVWGAVGLSVFTGTTFAIEASRHGSSTMWIGAAIFVAAGCIGAVLQATIGCMTVLAVLMWFASIAGLLLAITLAITSFFTDTNEQRNNLLTLSVALVAISLAVWLVAPSFPPASPGKPEPTTATSRTTLDITLRAWRQSVAYA